MMRARCLPARQPGCFADWRHMAVAAACSISREFAIVDTVAVDTSAPAVDTMH